MKILENWYGIKLRINSVLLAIISLIFLLVVPPIQDFVNDILPLQLNYQGLVAIGLSIVLISFLYAILIAYSYVFDLSMGKKPELSLTWWRLWGWTYLIIILLQIFPIILLVVVLNSLEGSSSIPLLLSAPIAFTLAFWGYLYLVLNLLLPIDEHTLRSAEHLVVGIIKSVQDLDENEPTFLVEIDRKFAHPDIAKAIYASWKEVETVKS